MSDQVSAIERSPSTGTSKQNNGTSTGFGIGFEIGGGDLNVDGGGNGSLGSGSSGSTGSMSLKTMLASANTNNIGDSDHHANVSDTDHGHNSNSNNNNSGRMSISAMLSSPVDQSHLENNVGVGNQRQLQQRKIDTKSKNLMDVVDTTTDFFLNSQQQKLQKENFLKLAVDGSAMAFFENFQQKITGLVELDSSFTNKFNVLKYLENEAKLLNNDNDVTVSVDGSSLVAKKLIEFLKKDLLSKDNKIMDKAVKREKLVKQELEMRMLESQQQALYEAEASKLDGEHHDAKNSNNNVAGEGKRKRGGSQASSSAAAAAAGGSGTTSTSTSTADNAMNGPPPKRRRGGPRGGNSSLQNSTVPEEDVNSQKDIKKRRPGGGRKRTAAGTLKTDASNGDDIAGEDADNNNNNNTYSTIASRRRRGGPRRKASTVAEEEIDKQINSQNSTSGTGSTKVKLKLNLAAGPPTEEQAQAQAQANKNKDQHQKENASEQQQPKKNTKEQRAIDKQYDNVYLSIWKDLSRKDGPKIYRVYQQSQQAKQLNLKKTAMLAARESKRWQLQTNKSQKDLQTKARRSMREMFSFWKKNEREERDLRKKAEKEALDQAKREEDEREAKRQSKKLNFLITQTELYSHFIGKKIKTDEIEGSMSDKALALKSQHHGTDPEAVNLKDAINDISSIDFDAQNDDELKKAAAANAQTALLKAQQKAKQFNNDVKDINIDDDEMNFQNPTSFGDITIEQPKSLTCTLKEYQLKGLNWLANLYDQGINGILADEMGLGKTVQSISVLAYLAETHNIWGPFLVVTPASTLHNWQQEISKFLPNFKVLPYWGNSKDRKVLRKFWDRKKIVYDKDSPFHVLVTSYQLVVADVQYFQRVKWQYMILDEAQAIKSSQSSRWKSLLSFQCRNRLLLTGTPIQNSMQELWALLHFIMPSLFDSHDEFSEWFSKDIESHAQSNTQLNEQQLRRLHVILKPFMLRRIKKNVQSELGDKIEIDLYCNLTNRQKKLYQMLKSQISVMDLMDKLKGDTTTSKNLDENTDSLMNLVMQFRKVCNHPDLFERADTKSAFTFSKYAVTASFLKESHKKELDFYYSTRNEIEYKLPKLIYDDLLRPHENNTIFDKDFNSNHLLNIWSPNYIKENNNNDDVFTWLKFISMTANEIIRIARSNLLENAINLRNYNDEYPGDYLNRFKTVYNEEKNFNLKDDKFFLINELNPINKVNTNMNCELKELFTVRKKVYTDMYLNVAEPSAFDPVVAPPIEISCSRQNFNFDKENSLFNSKIQTALMPLSLDYQYELMSKNIPIDQFPKAEMLPASISNKIGFSTIHLPSMKRFVIESGKLAKLDQLLVGLKKHDHKVLIYFQMTRMMDLMEEYLKYKQYKYIRLDGSSKLSDRRDLVHDWQTRPELFIFLLSTRAGGLGINLTAADTVVFYDSDWNPTIDSQAMDRAHRLGQTRQVTVYRLLVKGTIEERMRDRAKQKEHVQQVVMEGKANTDDEVSSNNNSKGKNSAVIEKKKEVAMLLLGKDEDDI